MKNIRSRIRNTAYAVCLLGSAFALPANAVICSTDSNIAIPDGSGSATSGGAVSVSIIVPSSPGTTVVDLDFDLAINHTYVGDLVATLTSPAGTTVTLMDRPGVPASTFGCSGNNISGLTLDDAAGTSIETQCAGAVPTISGTHQPTGSLSAFNGELVSGTWTLSVTDNAGQDLGTIIAGNNCLDLSTTPVTLSSFKARKRGKYLKADWETASESFNLGFHLWGEVDGEWQQLNRGLIGSQVVDSSVPQNYRDKINVLKLDGELTRVGISSVSTSGQEEFYGPFEIGEKYGDEAVPKYIDWTYQRNQHDKAMQSAGYVKKKGRWIRNNERRQKIQTRQEKRFPDVLIDIESAGVYQLSYEDLKEQGIDLRGMPVHKMALTRNTERVARVIINENPRYKRRFGPGSVLQFYAEGPSESHSRYVAVQPYRLSLNSAHVLELREWKETSDETGVHANPKVGSHSYRQAFGDKNLYSFGLAGDGWYDSSIRAIRSIGTKIINLEVPSDADLGQASEIALSLYGVTNFPRVDADGDGDLEPTHHYRVYLNRTEFPEAVIDGYANGKTLINVVQKVSGQLRHGLNEIQIELIPDNGHGLDLAYLIDGSLSYERPNKMASQGLSFIAPADDALIQVDANGLEVDSVIAVDSEGNAAFRSFNIIDDSLQLSLLNNGSQRGPVKLFIQERGNPKKPKAFYYAAQTDSAQLDLSEIDYVVIADDSLRGETLQSFVTRQNELGRNTKVVSSQSIFNTYSDGSAVPHAIADYLAEQSQTSQFKYVLLVGGHTYNYRGYNTDESNRPINLIPSFYRGSEAVIRQIPTAVPFVDFDKDGAPDRAIGRWPVRDQAQLKLIVEKTLAWHAEGSHRDSMSALFIADAKDQQNNFNQSVQRLKSSLGSQAGPWPEPKQVILDGILIDESIDAGEKLTYARSLIVDAINQGPALTVYSGHGAPGMWGRQGLVYGPVSDQLENAATPTLIVPLACYTTYYETPEVKSLPEVLLTDSAGGAVAITGAALLSRSGDNERFGRALLKKLSVSAMDLGTAVLSIKRDIHKISPRHQTVVDNWITLGDPTLSFGLVNTEPSPIIDDSSPDKALNQE